MPLRVDSAFAGTTHLLGIRNFAWKGSGKASNAIDWKVTDPSLPLSSSLPLSLGVYVCYHPIAYAEVGCFVDKPGEDRIKINQLDSETMTAEVG